MSEQVVPALTEALVDANDRLLGLIRLTEITLTSLDETTRVDAIATRAMELLGLDGLAIDGLRVDEGEGAHTWGRPSTEHDAQWASLRDLDALGHVGLTCWRDGPFDTGDQKLLAAVANVMAGAIRTARQHQAALEQAVVAREHDAAARLTAATLGAVDRVASVPGVDTHVHATPARTTGGDLWLCRVIDETLWFAVGDISGKGLPAAVLMSTVVAAANAAIDRHHGDGVEAVLEAIEAWVRDPLESAGLFATFALATWSAADGLMIANAGHSPIIKVVNAASPLGRRIEATSPPLGVIGGLLPETEHHDLEPGDLVVIATDGFSEQRDPQGQMFGEDTFDAAVAEAAALTTAEAVGEMLVAAVLDHAAGADQDDDRTMFTLKVLT